MEDEEKAMQVRVDYKKFVFATPEIEEPVRKLASERRLATLLTICLLYLIVSFFYVEGVSTIFFLVIMWFSSDTTESTPLFTECDKLRSLERVTYTADRRPLFVKCTRYLIATVTDWHVLLCTVIHFALNYSIASIAASWPVIVEPFQKTIVHSLFTAVFPFMISTTILFVTSAIPYQVEYIIFFLVGGLLVETIGFMLIALTPFDRQMNTIGLFLVLSGAYTAFSKIIVWYFHNLNSEAIRCVDCPFMFLSILGIALGTFEYNGPQYFSRFTIMCAVQAWAMACTIALYTLCRRVKHRRRNKLHGNRARFNTRTYYQEKV